VEDTYYRLREHLNRLPGGFPATETGVEIRLLKRLFSPEEAHIAQFLTMKLEPVPVIAARAGMSDEDTAAMLAEMAKKGLVFSIETPDRPTAYMAAQFVIGIWEYHVNQLDADFVRDMEEYTPILAREAFDKLPQLRTIPVGQSVSADLEVLPYEQAEAIVRKQQKFLVAPCICRREHRLKGKGCDKLMDACLIFGWGADFYERNGLGRKITLEETLGILKEAEKEGLVLQPSNSQDIVNICCCCGDCCQILLHLKRHPKPASLAATPFVAELDSDICNGCETCLTRCQMEALTMDMARAVLNPDRCIGCGLCVSTCPTDALTLKRKAASAQPVIAKNPMEALALRKKIRSAAE
jgi:Na+-translocating ferredoxin:NAD+ oxidoreductase subunit B